MKHDEVEHRQLGVQQPLERSFVEADISQPQRVCIFAPARDVLRIEVARMKLAARIRSRVHDSGMAEAGAELEIGERPSSGFGGTPFTAHV
ncbi:MAG: hypothetical protein WDO56_27965 [Gammaproteobacteria bacterium]